MITSSTTVAGSRRALLACKRRRFRPAWKAPLLPLACVEPDDRYTHVRSFHATPKQEILPLVGLALVLVVGRYSVKALMRMDSEWEDYQWELQAYEKQLARTSPNADRAKAIAIDVGSIYTKMAISHPKPHVLTNREGDRYVFNGMVRIENDGANDETDSAESVKGRAALERFFYSDIDDDAVEHSRVILPWRLWNDEAYDFDDETFSQDEAYLDFKLYGPLCPAFDELREQLQSDLKQPLRRLVVTAPASQLQSRLYKGAFARFSEFFHYLQVTLLPDPVAAVWGAQRLNLLPIQDDPSQHQQQPILVIDVGGLVTQLSVVRKDVILHSVSIPFGGEDFVFHSAALLLQESPMPLTDARSLSAIHNQARIAVAELSTKPNVSVHVPYLFPEPGNHHLDTSLSRSVLEQAVNDDLAKFADHVDDDDTMFSCHMPPPSDLTSVWTSSITHVLEKSAQMPTNVQNVLVVGGGSKPPIVLETLRTALNMLMGADTASKLVVPDSAGQMELTVIGAATMLDGYEYSYEDGLKRIE